MLHSINIVIPENNRRLWLVFDYGTTGTCDLSAFIARGGVARCLADPVFFAKARRSRDGSFITWPGGEVELCAQSLYLEITEKPEQKSDTREHPLSADA